ncbi:MAG: histone deacetylase [Candidatus Thorarchaeota archaeon]|nr:histone deacetylase [Candidatus Thorarchaeota archaeon]
MTAMLVYHELYEKHLINPGHPERPERLEKALKAIRDSRLLERGVQMVTPGQIPLERVYAIHSREYVEAVRQSSMRGGALFTPDTGTNAYTFDAAVMAAAGGTTAIDKILAGETDNAYIMCRPPGHHAEEGRAFGFCFFNNIAIAAQYLLQRHGIQRVMIVDYDGHHGNGTQNSFYSTDKVLYVGFHQDGRWLFPGTGFADEIGTGEGRGYNVNLPMCPGAGDDSYLLAFSRIVEPLAAAYRPEFILVSVGYDCHHSDPLTNLGMTLSGIASLNGRLLRYAEEYSNRRIACFLEGGYNLDVVSAGSVNLLEGLAGLPITAYDDHYKENPACFEYTKGLIDRVEDLHHGLLL